MASPGSAAKRAADLMAEGLDHYGQDRVERAAACWREALRLDPQNEEVRDYLRTAGFEPAETAPAAAAPPLRPEEDLLGEARRVLAQGRPREALELLQTLDRAGDLRAQAFLELLRAHLYAGCLERLDGGGRPLRQRMATAEVLRFNLPADAGFLLSMIDGATTAQDLVTLSGLDPFDALLTLDRLVEAGIVELRT